MRLLAHGLGGRADLPVPVWLARHAAAPVLIVSFFMPRPPGERADP
jgi:hypothetical protein